MKLNFFGNLKAFGNVPQKFATIFQTFEKKKFLLGGLPLQHLLELSAPYIIKV